MKKFAIILSGILFAVNLSACQSKKVVHSSEEYRPRTFNLEKFKSMEVYGSLQVVYTQIDKKPFYEISGPDDVISDISLQVRNNTLIVKYENRNKRRRINTGRVRINISGPALEKIDLSGSGKVDLRGEFRSKKDLILHLNGSGKIIAQSVHCNTLYSEISGSGNIQLDQINAKHVESTISGSGYIKLSGNNRTGIFQVNGSGNINAESLTVGKATARVNGSGLIKILAIETLEGRVNGSGRVFYRGNPSINFSGKGLRKL